MNKRLLLIVICCLVTILLQAQVSLRLVPMQEDAVGDSLQLQLCMDNSDIAVKAMQCDIHLPASISFNEVSPILPSRAQVLDLEYKFISDKRVRILLSSGANKVIKPDTTALMFFNVSVSSDDNDKESEYLEISDTKLVFDTYGTQVIESDSMKAFEPKPSFVLTYVNEGEIVHRDTIKMDQFVVAPNMNFYKEGYTFSGWAGLPQTMPAKDLIVVAKYDINSYELLYKVDGEEYRRDSLEYMSYVPSFVAPTKEGYTFSGWDTIPNRMPAKDWEVNGSFHINTYQISYRVDGQLYEIDSVQYADSIQANPAPLKEGYTFSGWEGLPQTMPAKDLIVVAKYDINSYELLYKVDGEEYRRDSLEYMSYVPSFVAPTKEGYTFSGWDTIPNRMPAKDWEVNGSFHINTYQISYRVDGQLYETDSVQYADSIQAKPAPLKDGYTFVVWDGLPQTMPAKDLIVVAKYALNANQVDAQGLAYRQNETKEYFEVFAYADTLRTDVVIPSEIFGMPVAAISDSALCGANKLRTLAIPSSVKQIGKGVLSGCGSLLLVDWNAQTSVRKDIFDNSEVYGNMLVFTSVEGDFDGNLVVNGVAENIVLVENKPFYNDRNFKAKNVSYSKIFAKKTYLNQSAGWEAMILPFNVETITSIEKDVTLLPFGLTNESESLPCWLATWVDAAQSFVDIQYIKANTPFIMAVPNSEDYQDEYNVSGLISFSAKDETIHKTDLLYGDVSHTYSMRATYQSMSADKQIFVLNDDTAYVDNTIESIMPGGAFVSDRYDVAPFEAYLYSPSLKEQQSFLRVAKDMTTAIERLIMHRQQNDHWYNLQGQRLRTRPTQPGLYIHNGQKILIQ